MIHEENDALIAVSSIYVCPPTGWAEREEDISEFEKFLISSCSKVAVDFIWKTKISQNA